MPRAEGGGLTATPLWKTFAVFLAPMLLSNILQSLSGTLNNVYLGQMLGVQALAAVSALLEQHFPSPSTLSHQAHPNELPDTPFVARH